MTPVFPNQNPYRTLICAVRVGLSSRVCVILRKVPVRRRSALFTLFVLVFTLIGLAKFGSLVRLNTSRNASSVLLTPTRNRVAGAQIEPLVAGVGPHMTNTDSTPFMDFVPSISLRENERGMHTGGGWHPTWHQPIDLFATFSDKDFRLGLNAAQTTGGALGLLAGVALVK